MRVVYRLDHDDAVRDGDRARPITAAIGGNVRRRSSGVPATCAPRLSCDRRPTGAPGSVFCRHRGGSAQVRVLGADTSLAGPPARRGKRGSAGGSRAFAAAAVTRCVPKAAFAPRSPRPRGFTEASHGLAPRRTAGIVKPLWMGESSCWTSDVRERAG
jgi:hypothetical protein